ncbi:MAG: hypothetical protein IJF73_00515 [Clostridia bacterium]|nr:hypothetical protein [Clostridia bacterium]
MKKGKKNASRMPLCRRGLLLLCLFSLLLSLTSCDSAPAIVREGLTVLPSDDTVAPPAEGTLALGQEAAYTLLSHYVRATTVAALPPATVAALTRHAEVLSSLLWDTGLTDGRYREVAALLKADGPAAIDAYLASDGGLTAPEVRALYLSLSEKMGAERLGRFAYTVALYRYEDLAATAMARYEKYGYPHLLLEAERLAAERATLLSDVGEEGFTAAMQTAVMLADLATGTAAGEELLAFSPTELLLFLRYIPLGGLTLTPEGWELFLSLLSPPSGSYRGRLFAAAEDNGDLSRLAAVLPTAVSLLSSVRDGMTEREARLLQAGDTAGLLHALLKGMSPGEREVLFALLETPLTYADYEALAAEEYGEDFLTYRSSLTPATAEELTAATAETFASVLERYLFRISPVLTYRGVR